MTETLKTVLDREASSVAFALPDVDAITRAGRRRVRRRRSVTALAGIATLALGVGGAAVFGDDGEGDPVATNSDGSAAPVSWAVGSTIHDGDETIEVGHAIRSYVRTSAGFVVVDDADVVWSVTGGAVTEIGHAAPGPDEGPTGGEPLAGQRLAADPRGPLVGWVGSNPSGGRTFEVYDQASGETQSFTVPGGRDADAAFFAIDDRTGYWRTQQGVFAVYLDSGDEPQVTTVTEDSARDFTIYSVEDGVVAFTPDGGTTVLAGASVEDARELLELQGLDRTTDPLLSPTGAWLSVGTAEVSESDVESATATPAVHDVGTGQSVTLELPVASFAVPGVWLDDDTLQVIAIGGPVEPSSATAPGAAFYACTVPSGSCELAADIGDVDLAGPDSNLAFPDGRWYEPTDPEDL
jgi:hypothetical protein